MSDAPTPGERAIAAIGYAAQFFYGGWFLFHGLNWWFAFFPEKSFAPGAQGFIPDLIRLHIFTVVKLLEVAIGLALLVDVCAALAIVAALPLTFVIAVVNASKGSPFGIAVATIIVALNSLMALAHLDRYLPILAKDAGPPNLRGLRAWVAGGPPPSPGAAGRLPPGRLAIAIVIGIAAPAVITYASILFSHPPTATASASRR